MDIGNDTKSQLLLQIRIFDLPLLPLLLSCSGGQKLVWCLRCVSYKSHPDVHTKTTGNYSQQHSRSHMKVHDLLNYLHFDWWRLGSVMKICLKILIFFSCNTPWWPIQMSENTENLISSRSHGCLPACSIIFLIFSEIKKCKYHKVYTLIAKCSENYV